VLHRRGVHTLIDHGRILAQREDATVTQIEHGEYPGGVGALRDPAGHEDDVLDLGQLVAQTGDLGELLGTLHEDDLRVGVVEDELHVVGDGGGVDGDGRRRGVHDPVVRQYPLVAGGAGDGDPVLGLDAEADESGADLGRLDPELCPGHDVPAAVLGREAVGPTVRGGGDTAAEHVADGLYRGVEVDGRGAGAGSGHRGSLHGGSGRSTDTGDVDHSSKQKMLSIMGVRHSPTGIEPWFIPHTP